jgi:hypothetical protein
MIQKVQEIACHFRLIGKHAAPHSSEADLTLQFPVGNVSQASSQQWKRSLAIALFGQIQGSPHLVA